MTYLDWIKFIGSVFLILGLIFMVFYFFKRAPFRSKSLSSEKLKFLTHLSLGPKKYLVVVQFLNKVLLIGICENQMTLLGEVKKDEWFEKGSNPTNFKKSFDNSLSSGINPPS